MKKHYLLIYTLLVTFIGTLHAQPTNDNLSNSTFLIPDGNCESLTIDGAVAIIDFPGDDRTTGPVLIDIGCGPSPQSAVASVMERETYWIMASSSEINDGTFQINLTDSEPTPVCSENDLCSNADDFGTILTFQTNPECLPGCNIGGTGDIGIPNCIPQTWITIYYTFTTAEDAERVTISTNSSDSNIDLIAVALLSDCNSGTYIDCAQGTGGSTSLNGIKIMPNTVYTIMIATPSGETGNFNVCVNTYSPPDEYCVGRDYGADTSLAQLIVTSTSMGSPASGPYQPGEEVSFEFYIPNYYGTTTAQWLQGIVPVFGPGWAPSSFNSKGKPVNSWKPYGHGATWAWYEDNEIFYNGTAIYYTIYTDTLNRTCMCYYTDPDCPNTGIVAGEAMPPGWYAYSPGSSSTCVQNGDPDFGWGDGLNGPWIVDFTLKVREFSGPESCSATGFVDCWVKMFTFSDEQLGCWQKAMDSNACASDEYKEVGGRNQCCQGPIVDRVEESICSGKRISIELHSSLDSQVIYHWTVSAPFSITGASGGSDQFIEQVLINNSDIPLIVTYHVYGIDTSSQCRGGITNIPVTVYPQPIVDFDVTVNGDSVIFNNLSENADSYFWDFGDGKSSTVENPTHIYDDIYGKQVTLTVYNNCDTVSKTVLIDSYILPIAMINVQSQEVCLGTSVTYNDVSQGVITSRKWIFEGGTPTTSNLQNPEVQYNATGRYDVTLIVDNSVGSDTIYWMDFITVIDIPIAQFDYEIIGDTVQFILQSQFSDEYKWGFGGGVLIDSSSLKVLYEKDGEYTVELHVKNQCGVDSISKTIVIETTAVSDIPKTKIHVYPNPFHNQINIRFNDELSGNVFIRLYNMTGQMVKEKKVSLTFKRIERLNVSDLVSGLYLLEIQQEGKVAYRKLIGQ